MGLIFLLPSHLAAMDLNMKPSLCRSSRGNPMPGYTGHRSGQVAAAERTAKGDSRRNSVSSQQSETSSAAGYKPGGTSHRVMKAVSGYTGFVPGKKSEPMQGKSFRETHKQAISERSRGKTSDTPPISGFGGNDRASNETSLHHVGVRVPGYGGHIAGNKADSLIAMSASRAAEEGWLKSARSANMLENTFTKTPRP